MVVKSICDSFCQGFTRIVCEKVGSFEMELNG